MRPVLRIIFCRILPFLFLAALIIGTERLVHRMSTIVVAPDAAKYSFLFVPTGASFEQVIASLKETEGIRRIPLIKKAMKLKKYDQQIKAGHYRLPAGMTANQLISMLSRGLQTPVKVKFQNVRKPEELAGKIAKQIEADSLSLLHAMRAQNDLFVYTIPNTYEFWWNTSADAFMEKMTTESKKFWNKKRKRAAKEAGLSIPEVVILASIVEKETAKNDEKPRIAGVYINRLHRGWPLQADPTLIFAANDFAIKRVLNKHKEIDSPYNTYKNKGLPPGPICLPSIASIDAVLYSEKHDYMYFCAKEDFSGYHVFAEDIRQHNRNAQRYRKALNAIEN
jgi:UPF0755 protein